MKVKNLIVSVALLTAIATGIFHQRLAATVIAAEQQNTGGEMAENGIQRMPIPEQEPAPADAPAQDAPRSRHQTSITDSLTFIREQGPDDVRASEFVGMPVTGANGAQIGEISDLIMNADYRVTAVVLSTGGIFGIGGKRIALSLNDLVIAQTPSGKERNASVNITRQDIIDAPEFRSKDGGFLTLSSATMPTVRTDDGKIYKFVVNTCPGMQTVTAEEKVYLF